VTARQWIPLRGIAGEPGVVPAAARMVEAARADLACGGYRWKDTPPFVDSVVALHDRSGFRALAAHRLEINEDPEVAVAAGRCVIRVPLLTGATAQPPSVEDVAGLIDILRSVHGSLRISVNQPAPGPAWAAALAGAGFRPDSAMSIRTCLDATPRPPRPVQVRAATAGDGIAAGDLFEQSLATLATLSPFVAADPAAAGAVRDRISAGSRTGDGSPVWVAEDGHARVVGIVEVSTTTSPADYAVLQTPIGRSGCIDWIAVAPSHRGAGIGTALVAHALRHLAAAGATTAFTYHLTGEHGPADFWARCGFTPAWTTWELAPPRGATGG
jgi:GNAT superfamily N-acetyltransferase